MPSPNVRIRFFEPSDAPAVLKAVHESIAQVSPWLPDLRADLTLDDVKAYIDAQPLLQAERKAYNFCIVETGNDRFLGGCGLTHIDGQHQYANLY